MGRQPGGDSCEVTTREGGGELGFRVRRGLRAGVRQCMAKTTNKCMDVKLTAFNFIPLFQFKALVPP